MFLERDKRGNERRFELPVAFHHLTLNLLLHTIDGHLTQLRLHSIVYLRSRVRVIRGVLTRPRPHDVIPITVVHLVICRVFHGPVRENLRCEVLMEIHSNRSALVLLILGALDLCVGLLL